MPGIRNKLLRVAVYAVVAAVMAVGGASGCKLPTARTQREPVVHRMSVDRAEEVIYLSPRLALFKKYHKLSESVSYFLAYAHFMGTPEYGDSTGDMVDTQLAVQIESLGYWPDRSLIVARGVPTNPRSEANPTRKRYIVVELGRVSIIEDPSLLQEVLVAYHAKLDDLRNVAEFFNN